ncbi:hypothetical protein FB45DRAFT_899814 [Roridomyces roridus]|uniref:Cyclochlorotine biosynthesis protein O n=1 Tax=Roridomyces roridus TaxID=1738132 RepID=A0AAD7FSX4_9AGAR|nr:hypothetical protein FB45DRAFT_899814 [Roridomyces roridus]
MVNGKYEYDPLPSADSEAKKRRFDLFRVLLSVSLLLNVGLALGWILNSTRSSPQFASYSPAQAAIGYKVVKFHRGLRDDLPIYERPPSPEGDQAWGLLYEYALSRIPKSEAVKLTNKTWPILDEPGNYIIALDVFHQLHCLDLVRQQLELHHSNTRNYTGQSMPHLRHCIGAIRQALMCHADTTPIIWQWSDRLKEAEQLDDILHSCKDFDRIQDWARQRSVGLLPDLTVYLEG